MPTSPVLHPAAADTASSSSAGSSLGGSGIGIHHYPSGGAAGGNHFFLNSSSGAGSSARGGGGSSSGIMDAPMPGRAATPTRAYALHEAGTSSGSLSSAGPSPRIRARHGSQDTGTGRSATLMEQRTGAYAAAVAAAGAAKAGEFSPLAELYAQLDKEEKIYDGAQSILQLINQDGFASSGNRLPSVGAAAALRSKVEAELFAAEERIVALQAQIQDYHRIPPPADEPPLAAAYIDLSPAFASPSPSPKTDLLPLQPVSPASVPPRPLAATSQTESIPDPLESEATESGAEDPHSTSAARGLVLSLLQSIQNLIEDGAPPQAGSSRATTGSFGQPSYGDYGSSIRIQLPNEGGSLSLATTNSVLELLDRLFTVLRRSNRLRYEFLGEQPFRTNIGPSLSTARHDYTSDDEIDDDDSDADNDEFSLDPLLDTFIRLLADHVGRAIRAKSVRLISHLLVPPSAPFLARCRQRGLDLYLSRALSRDAKFDSERVEVLRLIRRGNELSEHTRAKQWSDISDSKTEDDDVLFGRKGKRRRADDTLDPDEPERWLRPEPELGKYEDLPFSPVLIRTLASGVGEEKDRLRWLCLETLAELAIRHPHLVHRGDGFGALIQALRNGPPEYVPNLAQVLLFLMDTPSSRRYLRPGLDLEAALSPITDVPFKKTSLYEAEVRAGVKAVSVILRSWSGLAYLCMHDRRSIGSIVQALVAGTRESKEAVIKMLQDLFELAQGRVKPGASGMTPASTPTIRQLYTRQTATTAAASPPTQSAPLPIGTSSSERHQNGAAGQRARIVAGPTRPNLLEQYATLLLAVFVDAGIVDALVHVVEAIPGPLLAAPTTVEETEAARAMGVMMLPTAEETDLAEKRKENEMGRKAVRLLGTIMQVARKFLPLDDALGAQSLPRLFALAANLQPDSTLPLFRKGRAFAASRSRAPEVQRNGFRTFETSALSAAGRGLATSALSVIDSMDRPRDGRTSSAHGAFDPRKTRFSSDTIMPGDLGPNQAPAIAAAASTTAGAFTTPNLEGIQNGTDPKSPDSPMSAGPLSPVPDEASRRLQQRNVELAKVRAGMQMDDAHFRHLLIESQVLTHKEHVKWNLSAINDLLEGPLMNPRRLEEVTRGSKFVRRLLSFFNPTEQRFALIANTASNRKYVRLGCTMIRAFLATPEGVKILSEDPLLRDIRSALERLDPLSLVKDGGQPMPTGDQYMSKARIEETLSYGYFEMIGILTRSPAGLDLLSKVHMFTVIYNLSGIQSRDYLIREVIKNFDYSIDGHTRIILSKALTSTYRNMRIFATRILTGLIAKSVEPGQWLIALLLTQLYDTASEVRELAVRAVMQACSSPAVLELVVSMRPTLEHLGEDSHPLLLRFMSSSNGFRFLLKGDYIIREMEDWLNIRNVRYMLRLELLLARALSMDSIPEPAANTGPEGAGTRAGQHATEHQYVPESLWHGARDPFDGTVPPHFFGELTKTAEGCALLSEKGHFSDFAAFIRRHGKESDDVEIIAKLKSVLWTVGNIGANAKGLNFLEAEDIVSVIVEIAERSQVLSVRGVGFFVIGMIASTPQGAELLHDYGWRTAWTAMGLPTGVCIPNNIDRFIALDPWRPARNRLQTFNELMPSSDPVEKDILSAISELGNGIVAKLAHRELLKLKACYPEYFEEVPAPVANSSKVIPRSNSGTIDNNTTPTIGSIDDSSNGTSASAQSVAILEREIGKRILLLVRALELLEHFPLPMSMRRAVWDLFDVRLDEALVQDLKHARARLVEDRKHWEHNTSDDTAHRSSSAAGASRDSGTGTLDGKAFCSSPSTLRTPSGMPIATPGPGTAAYAAVVGLRDGLVAGGARPAMQIQLQRERERAKAATEGARDSPSVVAAGSRGGAAPNLLAARSAGVGTLGGERMRLLVNGVEEEDEEDEDTDEDSDEDAAFVGAVPQQRADAASALQRGPSVVISTATYDSAFRS